MALLMASLRIFGYYTKIKVDQCALILMKALSIYSRMSGINMRVHNIFFTYKSSTHVNTGQKSIDLRQGLRQEHDQGGSEELV